MITAACIAILAASVPQQDATIAYHISFENAAHHEARITIKLEELPLQPLLLSMSRSSPGRYALHEFAKNVYSVTASDARGKALEVLRPNNHQWRIPEHEGSVSLSYTLYADRADGTYSQVDLSHAHLNMPATFMWPKDLPGRRVEIEFELEEDSNWEVVTQLFPTDSKTRFEAPSLDYFLDSPTELSAFSLREWTLAEADGRERKIRMAIHHQGTEAAVDRFSAWTRKLVEEQRAVFGELPDFDAGSYTFIADYLPHASRDGMEHRNSTILSSSASLESAALELIRTVSHEFFHCWNVERIRPASLEPFDFERANMSRELWFAEGFTSYYDKLFLRRAGIVDDTEYVAQMGERLLQVLETPALGYGSPVEMSMQAPFVDAATSVDPHNRANTFISYYTIGAAVALGLDLSLRTRFASNLDDYMRLVWVRHGRPELPYSVEDLEALLAEFTGDAAFAADFFGRFIRGRELPDFQELLGHAGIKLYRLDFDMCSLDYAEFRVTSAGAELLASTKVGTPLYAAGLDKGAIITSIAGQPITTEAELKRVVQAHKPGRTVEVHFLSRGVSRIGQLTLHGPSSLHLSTLEDVWLTPTAEMLAFRAAWLGSRAGN